MQMLSEAKFVMESHEETVSTSCSIFPVLNNHITKIMGHINEQHMLETWDIHLFKKATSRTSTRKENSFRSSINIVFMSSSSCEVSDMK